MSSYHSNLDSPKGTTIGENNIQINNFFQYLKEEKKDEGILELPFIVMAMTNQEAEKLYKNKLECEDPDDFACYDGIKKALSDEDENLSFLSRYRQTRDEWHPFSDNGLSVKEIINHVFYFFNKIKLENRFNQSPYHHLYIKDAPFQPYIFPIFVSQDFFLNKRKNRETSKLIKENFGRTTIIIDSLSLFDNRLLNLLSNSHEAVKTVIILSYQSKISQKLNESIKRKMNLKLGEAHDKLYEYLDPTCGFITNDREAFKRWLYLLLPGIIKEHKFRVSENYAEFMQKKLQTETKGFESAIFEIGGRK